MRDSREHLLGPEIWVLLALVLAALCGLGVWMYNANKTPLVAIPPPYPMPARNAYDYFRAAAQGVETANVGGTDLAFWGKADPDSHPLAERQAAVAAVQNQLATLHEGFRYPYEPPASRSFAHLFPEFAEFRNLARYLKGAGKVKQEQGDWQGAMESYLDCLRLGGDMKRHGTMISLLVSIAIQAIGRVNTAECVDHLTAPQARAAAQRLEAIIAQEPPYADTLQEDKWATQAALLELFQRNDWRKQLLTMSDTPQKISITLSSKRHIMQEITKENDANIARAQLPYALARTTPPPVSQYPFSATFEKARFKYEENKVDNALLLVQLALRAYQAEHGNYPATLQALTPRYLTKIPTDNFATAGTFHYAPRGAQYLLYSVGPDGKDDGGRPCERSGGSSDNRYIIDEDSPGDIVAGVNK
jgi:hypothetical protein